MALDWQSYPPVGHKDRVDSYTLREALFLGQHKEAFGIKPQPYQMLRYVVCNFAQLVSKLSADFLFGEEPSFLAGGDVESETTMMQDCLDGIVKRNRLHTTNYESSLANSFRGDALYKVRWGEREPGSGVFEVIISEVPAGIYFPELDDDDVRHVQRVTLAWVKRDPNPLSRDLYLRMEEHEVGVVRHKLFKLALQRPVEQVPLATLEQYIGLADEEQTGLDVIPVFHVPNYRFGSRFWGISDYEGLETLFESANERVSQVDEVLRKHVAPKLILPPGYVDQDGKVSLQRLETMTLQAGEQPPSYITWDAHLSAAFSQIDKLVELLFMFSETAPTAFGLDKYGVAESGRALRLRLLRTLAKVNRKRLYYDEALKQVLFTALKLEAANGVKGFTPVEPSIEWQDGLPMDMVEQVDIEDKRLAAGNTSLESSVRRLDGDDAGEKELERIYDEQGKDQALTGVATGKGRRAVPPPDQEDQEDQEDQGGEWGGSES